MRPFGILFRSSRAATRGANRNVCSCVKILTLYAPAPVIVATSIQAREGLRPSARRDRKRLRPPRAPARPAPRPCAWRRAPTTLKRSPIRFRCYTDWPARSMRSDTILIPGGGPPAHPVYCGIYCGIYRPHEALPIPAGRRGTGGPRPEQSQSRRQVGHRSSQRARTRAMARRAVGNESAKWRSGRERDRVGLTGPSGLGGKSAYALGDDEGVAT